MEYVWTRGAGGLPATPAIKRTGTTIDQSIDDLRGNAIGQLSPVNPSGGERPRASARPEASDILSPARCLATRAPAPASAPCESLATARGRDSPLVLTMTGH